jgi:hypothetical protein
MRNWRWWSCYIRGTDRALWQHAPFSRPQHHHPHLHAAPQPASVPPGLTAGDTAASFPQTTTAPSRGALTTDFLAGEAAPLEYLESLGKDYMGVTVAVGDLRTGASAFVCNRDGRPPRALAPGAYGVSNGFLGEWPKVVRGVDRLQAIIGEADLDGELCRFSEALPSQYRGEPLSSEPSC